MLKAVHLFNPLLDARYLLMISQGLWFHKDIEVSFSSPFVSLGKQIASASDNLEKDLLESDLIFRPDDNHFSIAEIDSILDSNALWHKVIYYDLKDEPSIDTHRLHTCAAYLKRSWPIGYDRLPRPYSPIPMLPIDFGMLNEYFYDEISADKDIDIACPFSHDPKIGTRRFSVVDELYTNIDKIQNHWIAKPTSGFRKGRRAIYEGPDNNPFIYYMSILKRSKIVFTAFPDPHDGDSRVWESFSSGAMVFMDRTYIPSPYPFIHNKHCYIFDARSRDSIKEAVKTAIYFLNRDNERNMMAQAGMRHAIQYHKPEDRVDLILKWNNFSREKRLEIARRNYSIPW